MTAQSTHTQRNCPNGYVPASSRKPRDPATFLAQLEAYVTAIDTMAAGTAQDHAEQDTGLDAQRGQRIKARRIELHLTQPAVVRLVTQAAYELPPTHELHPDRAGKPPFTLRGYQTYEQGGGIVWEKAVLLAQVLRLDVQDLMSGEAALPVTPVKTSARTVEGELADILWEIREQLDDQNRVLAEIKAEIAGQKQATAEAETARKRLLDAAAAATRAYEDAARRLGEERGKQAK
jgi:hypothetical protein